MFRPAAASLAEEAAPVPSRPYFYAERSRCQPQPPRLPTARCHRPQPASPSKAWGPPGQPGESAPLSLSARRNLPQQAPGRLAAPLVGPPARFAARTPELFHDRGQKWTLWGNIPK